jgi:hypothetical protein
MINTFLSYTAYCFRFTMSRRLQCRYPMESQRILCIVWGGRGPPVKLTEIGPHMMCARQPHQLLRLSQPTMSRYSYCWHVVTSNDGRAFQTVNYVSIFNIHYSFTVQDSICQWAPNRAGIISSSRDQMKTKLRRLLSSGMWHRILW